MPHSLHDLHWSARVSAVLRQLLSLVSAVGVGLTWNYWQESSETAWLVGWSVYCAIQILHGWLLVSRLDQHGTQRRAQANDPGAGFLFVLVTLAAYASLVAVIVAIDAGHQLIGPAHAGHLVLVFVSLAESWLLIQVAFALHYARTYYCSSSKAEETTPGLLFPGNREPDYLDFLYYATVVGMTSQVSDVEVGNRKMRILTMVHSVLSFTFNLAVLAIAVNVVASTLS